MSLDPVTVFLLCLVSMLVGMLLLEASMKLGVLHARYDEQKSRTKKHD